MADAERRLNNGKSRIDFQTDPSKYRHWKLTVDGEIATLLMDVDEKGTLFEGYELKLNSYDLGVDIELADAIDSEVVGIELELIALEQGAFLDRKSTRLNSS